MVVPPSIKSRASSSSHNHSAPRDRGGEGGRGGYGLGGDEGGGRRIRHSRQDSSAWPPKSIVLIVFLVCWGASFLAGFYGMLRHGTALVGRKGNPGSGAEQLPAASPAEAVAIPPATAAGATSNEERALSMLVKRDRRVVELITRQPSHKEGFWSKALGGSTGNPARRREALSAAIMGVDQALKSAGVDVWDDASCEDFYEKECPEWATREPCECTVRPSMRSSCKRTCGYCGPFHLLGKVLDKARSVEEEELEAAPRPEVPDGSHKPRGADIKLKITKIPKSAGRQFDRSDAGGGAGAPGQRDGGVAEVGAKGQQAMGSSEEKSTVDWEAKRKATADMLASSAAHRVTVEPEVADAFIDMVIEEQKGAYPPLTEPGPVPSEVSKRHEVETRQRDCTVASAADSLAVKAAVESKVLDVKNKGGGASRVLCLYIAHGDGTEHTANMAVHTWGGRCDGYLAVRWGEGDSVRGIVGFRAQAGPPPIAGWQLLRSGLVHVWRHYFRQGGIDREHGKGYDGLIIVRGMTAVLPGNLRALLGNEGANGGSKPRYIGRLASPHGGDSSDNQAPSDLMVLGGGGIVLNAAALRVLVARLHISGCAPKANVAWDDVMLAKCLAETSSEKNLEFSGSRHWGGAIWAKQAVIPEDSRDEGGKERFLPFPLGTHLSLDPRDDAQWFVKYTKSVPGGLKAGAGCCSERLVTFGVTKNSDMGMLEAYLHACGDV